MNNQMVYTAILAASFLALFAFAELLYHFCKVKAEITRKLVHFGTGLLTLLFPLLLRSHWLVLLLCAGFFVLLTLSLKFNLLRSINAIDRRSSGSLIYPLSVYICYLVYEQNQYQYYFFYVPILILAICDPLAALCGRKWAYGKFKAGSGIKTLMGSSVFFISALLVTFAQFFWSDRTLDSYLLIEIATLAMVTTLVEAISRNGFDNLSIPLSALGVLILA
jgi:phytol kinase